MTQYLRAFNPLSYETPRSVLSGVFRAGCSIVKSVTGVAASALGQSSPVQAVSRAVAQNGERLATNVSHFVIRKVQPYINGRLTDQLPIITRAQTDAFIANIFAPSSRPESNKANQSYLGFLLGCIKKVIMHMLKGDISSLFNNAIQRVLAEGRMQSIAFNVLTRINVYASDILKEASPAQITDHEIEDVLKDCHQKILGSHYFNKDISWIGQMCITPALGITFTREAFNGYVAAISGQIDAQLNAMNQVLGTQHQFNNQAQKEIFVKRMTLEIIQAITQELTDPSEDVNNPLMHKGLEDEAQKLMKSMQQLIPQNAQVFEAIVREEEVREAFDLEQNIEEIQEYVEESQVFLHDHPWIAKGLRLVGFDASAEATRERLLAMRIEAATQANEPEEVSVDEVHTESATLVSELLNSAIRSPKTVDLLFEDGFSISSLLENYRAKLRKALDLPSPATLRENWVEVDQQEVPPSLEKPSWLARLARFVHLI